MLERRTAESVCHPVQAGWANSNLTSVPEVSGELVTMMLSLSLYWQKRETSRQVFIGLLPLGISGLLRVLRSNNL